MAEPLLARRLALTVLLGVAVAYSGHRLAGQSAPTERPRLESFGRMDHAAQQAPDNQQFLQAFLRRGARLYLHRLDDLTCQGLFSLGDEALFIAAVGNTDGTDRNLVFIEGTGAPAHLDDGPYVFPADTFRQYWPPRPDLNTYWHETNHALLYAAHVRTGTVPYAASMDDPQDTDDHHPFIEGVGQRGAEAYGELLGFEQAVRRADQLESEYLAQGRDINYAVERQLWGDAHQRFTAFLQRMKRVANMTPELLANYRRATGVFFSTAEETAEFYRAGGLKRETRGEVLPLRPPTWVFYPELWRMPVKLQMQDTAGHDLELPGATARAPFVVKDDVYRQEIRVRVLARGSASRRSGNSQKDLAVGGAVARGRLRIRLTEDEPLVTLSLAQGPAGRPVDGASGPGGSSTHLFDVNLAGSDSQPIRLVFARRKLGELIKRTNYHVELDFMDSGAEALYDPSAAQVSFALGPDSAAGPKATAAASAAPKPPPAPPPNAPTVPKASEPAKAGLGLSMSWGPTPDGMTVELGTHEHTREELPPVLPSTGELELISGAVMHLSKGEWGSDGVVIEVFAKIADAPLATLQDHIATLRPREGTRDNGFFASFTHTETLVGGRRAFSSSRRSGSGLQGNRHYSIDLPGSPVIRVIILTDISVNRRNADVYDSLARARDALIGTIRFGGDPSALGVRNAPEAPLPKAFQGEAISAGELLKRPPPPPPTPSVGSRRRPSPTGQAPEKAPIAAAPTAPTAAPTAANPGAKPPATTASAADSYFAQGNTLQEAGKNQEAIDAYTKVIERNPRHSEAYRKRAISKLRLQQYREALADYETAIQLDPSNAGAYVGRGTARRRALSDVQGALADYTKAIELDPRHLSAYYSRGELRSAINDFAGAERDCQQSISLNPRYAEGYLCLGLVDARQKNYDKAIEHFGKVIEFDPGSYFGYLNRAIAYKDQGNPNAAWADLQKARALNGGAAVERVIAELEAKYPGLTKRKP